MEVFQKLKEFKEYRLEDNLYFLIGLFGIIVWQIIKELFSLINKLSKFIMIKFSDWRNKKEVKK